MGDDLFTFLAMAQSLCRCALLGPPERDEPCALASRTPAEKSIHHSLMRCPQVALRQKNLVPGFNILHSLPNGSAARLCRQPGDASRASLARGRYASPWHACEHLCADDQHALVLLFASQVLAGKALPRSCWISCCCRQHVEACSGGSLHAGVRRPSAASAQRALVAAGLFASPRDAVAVARHEKR